MARVLLADDNREVLIMLSAWLRLEDQHTVDTAADGAEALDFVLAYDYDVVVLDWEMPHHSGLDVCRRLKEHQPATPVLMLTGRDSVGDRVQGLDAGADDYLTKPFSAEELSARVRALLRRKGPTPAGQLASGPFTLHPSSRTVTANGMPIHLTPIEFDLLDFFLSHPGQAFGLDALVSRLWSDPASASAGAVRTAIGRLRAKLESAAGICPLVTERGTGYRWQPPEG